jgi:hypothetical protein
MKISRKNESKLTKEESDSLVSVKKIDLSSNELSSLVVEELPNLETL